MLRLAVGLIFGLGIGLFFEHFGTDYESHPPIWATAAVWALWLGAFIPWAGAGVMRRVNLGLWTATALAVIALTAWHRLSQSDNHGFAPPFFNISFLLYPFLFITHELIASADQSGKAIAPYSVYNDEAWHRGVQLALAVVFTALFWGILLLGATLLGMIGFKWLGEWLQKPWIAFPLSGLAIGAAVHLGDSQPKLINGVRALVLGILSWLLPVLTAIALLFAVSLAFSGLEPLWKTKAATASLLAGCVGLVLLINAAYQEGDGDRKVHMVLKGSARVACGLLLVFALLAAYSLSLRILQYGLTPERVLAGLGALIAVLFGLGYTAAAVWPQGRWLRWIEAVNVTLAFVMAALFLMVVTPVGDPNRLSVESQVARLQAGKIAPDAFDWNFLRFGGQAYGKDALKALAKTGKTEGIRKMAVEASREDYTPREKAKPVLRFTPDAKRIKMLSGTLPADFLAQSYLDEPYRTPACFRQPDKTCEGRTLDLDKDGADDVALLCNNYVYVFSRASTGWELIDYGQPVGEAGAQAFRAGEIAVEKPRWNRLRVGKGQPIEFRDGPAEAKQPPPESDIISTGF